MEIEKVWRSCFEQKSLEKSQSQYDDSFSLAELQD